ncbi:hypothetical protein [Thermococcus thermotolerans]|uniref:hypothetical protein n=1 Tax=Thermococcus thermotolerans TaxID=2969672 RepID=UPI00215790F0|nr:hypothetical protein [Thermococcus thermotolerans]
MRTGNAREYNILLFLELVVFTAGVALENTLLIMAFFILLMVTPVFFHGRAVRVKGRKITLEWGLLLKRHVDISFSEILDVIDASSSRYLILARYTPEILLVPLGMFIGGVGIFFTAQYRWVGLGWMFFGSVELVTYTISERKRAALIIVLITIVFSLLASIIKTSFVVPILVAGVIMAVFVREGGPMIMNTLFIVTERGVYQLRYDSKEEVKNLLSVIGDEGED